MKVRKGFYPQIFQCGVVPPQDGGLSLTPIESVFKGFRNEDDTLVLEMAGVDQVLFYGLRTNNYAGIRGSLMSHFPQAILSESVRNLASGSYVEDQERAMGRGGDWLFLDEDERALVQTVYLEYEPYLPLTIGDDREIRESGIDPLAGVVGNLVSNTSGETTDGRGSDRFGVRLVLRPADEKWGQKWQNRMQDRRDGEDRTKHVAQGEGPSTGTLIGLAGIGGLAFANYALWLRDMMPAAYGLDAAAVAGLAGFAVFRASRGGRRKRRPYIDERLVEEKLKALSYHCELQVVRVYRNELDEEMMISQVRGLVDAYRAFDNSAGNAWKLGELHRFDGQDVLEGAMNHPFRGGLKEVGFLDNKRSEGCVLTAREVASVWHLPLGTSELASMERASSVVLLPYTPELNQGGANAGPMVGRGGRNTLEVYLPESALAKHTLIVGKSGSGKSTTLKHVLAYKFRRKAEGLDDGAVVVIDPHSDLVHDLLDLVPPEVAHKVRLLDFGRMDRVPGMNLVDPALFPDRDRCVDTIIQTVKGLWVHWGNRLEDLLRRSLTMVYEFNQHEDTPDEEMLTMLDILPILEGGKRVGQGREAHFVLDDFQRHVLSRVRDPRLHQWMEGNFLRWDPGERAQAVAPVNSRVGYYAQNLRASVVMGQRKSTVIMSDVLEQGQILLVATASGAVGKDPAALMGGTVVSLIDSALRAQESIAYQDRKKCLIVCDEFQTVTGADWESMLAEDRKYGGSIMLATQSLMRLDEGERHLREGVLGNMGCFISFKLSGEDSRIVSREMGEDRVPPANFGSLDPFNCYVKVDSDTQSFPAFSMLSMPAPGADVNAVETRRRVMEDSVNYTVDWDESRRRIEADVRRQMDIGQGGTGVGFVTEESAKGGGDKKKGGGNGRGGEENAGVAVLAGVGGGEPVAVPAGGGGGEVGGDAAVGRNGDVEGLSGADVPGGEAGRGGGEVPGVPGKGSGGVGSLVPGFGGGGDVGEGGGENGVPKSQTNGNGHALGDGNGFGLGVGARPVLTGNPHVDAAAAGGSGGRSLPMSGWLKENPFDKGGDEAGSVVDSGVRGDVLAESGVGEGVAQGGLDDDVPGTAVTRRLEPLERASGNGGEGAEAAGVRNRRREGKPAFGPNGKSPTGVIGEASSLRGLDAWAVEESAYRREELEVLATRGDDSGVQAVFRKVFAGWHGPEMKREHRLGKAAGRQALLDELGIEDPALSAGDDGAVAEGQDSGEGGGKRERMGGFLGDVIDIYVPPVKE